MNDKPYITPQTKVGELLKAYPELEEKLIELAPQFKKLKNPILRRTIARVTSLKQAAAVGGIPVDSIVNTLRKEAGQEEMSVHEAAEKSSEKPSWMEESKIANSFDARPVIEQGGHPLEKVFKETTKLEKGEIYELITSFYPAPLVDKIKERGFAHWSQEEGGIHKNYFMKK